MSTTLAGTARSVRLWNYVSALAAMICQIRAIHPIPEDHASFC